MKSQKIIARNILRKAFPGIPEREADDLVSFGKIQSHDPGIVLCKEGAIEYTFFIILDGRVSVTKVINDAESRQLKILVPGDFFGEMGLIHDAPRAATVTTLDVTTVLTIHKEEFELLLERSPSVSVAMVKEVSRRLRENDELAIDDLKLKASELANAYQRLAEDDFARREFLTTIAHELRTPLTAANGFLEMARIKINDQQTLEMALDTVRKNLQQIISLVNDILFLQEVELVLPEMVPQDIAEIVMAAVDQVKDQAKNNHISIHLNIARGSLKILGHSTSLKRALTMVLDNAVKFSPKGGVVEVSVGGNFTNVWIRIADSGVGIPPDALPNIFDRFFHTEEVGNELYGGLGLGLAITKQVIEQHGGRIDVQSDIGKGSIFTIALNVAKESPNGS